MDFTLGSTVVSRSLKVVTYHARDVYPMLLRSTLLVRLVAAYEAYLVDTVEEISQRTSKPFLTDSRIEMSQSQFLTIQQSGGVLSFIVSKKLRQLTSGGFDEIRKWYSKDLSIDILADGQSLSDLKEIHDRRHVFVHRSGYADSQYCNTHPGTGVKDGDQIPVDEGYLLAAIATLEKSALHLKRRIEAEFPGAPDRLYSNGTVVLADEPECLQFLCLKPKTTDGWTAFADLEVELPAIGPLKDLLVWMSKDSSELRFLIGAPAKRVAALRRFIQGLVKNGDIELGDGFKIKR